MDLTDTPSQTMKLPWTFEGRISMLTGRLIKTLWMIGSRMDTRQKQSIRKQGLVRERFSNDYICLSLHCVAFIIAYSTRLGALSFYFGAVQPRHFLSWRSQANAKSFTPRRLIGNSRVNRALKAYFDPVGVLEAACTARFGRVDITGQRTSPILMDITGRATCYTLGEIDRFA
jgi:hypothetical protein